MRQPQASSTSGGIAAASTAPVAEPSRMPPTAPQQATAPIVPRCRAPACSTMKTMEVVYSPPTDRPWIMRSRVSRIGAATPST